MLYIYTPQLVLIGVVERYQSLVWTRRHRQAGDFKLLLDWDKESWKLLAVENLIYRGGKEIAFITSVSYDTNDNGDCIVEVNGSTVEKYFKRRVIERRELLEGTAEECIRELVMSETIATLKEARKIPMLTMTRSKGYQERVTRQFEFDNLESAIEDIARETDLGYCIEVDVEKKTYTFDIKKGMDRSINQKDRAPCIFSADFENILGSSYLINTNDLINNVLVEGEETSVELGNETGINRIEAYLKSGKSKEIKKEEENVILTEEEYRELLITEGTTILEENKIYETIETKANPMANLIYKKHYDLGDLVTYIDKRTGLAINVRITEIEEIKEDNREEIILTFGEGLPTLAQKIKRKVK